MSRALFILSIVVLSALAEPPVPQGQYGAPGGYSSGGYPGGSPSRFPGGQGSGFGNGNGQFGGGDEPMTIHEQDFQQSPGVIWGKWSVVLPDGRTQKVEYDADEDGFHPIITYEHPEDNTLGGAGGYSNGGNGGYSGGNGGYSSGGNGGSKNGGSRNGGYSNAGSSTGSYSNGASGGSGYNY